MIGINIEIWEFHGFSFCEKLMVFIMSFYNETVLCIW